MTELKSEKEVSDKNDLPDSNTEKKDMSKNDLSDQKSEKTLHEKEFDSELKSENRADEDDVADRFTGTYWQWLKQEFTGWDRLPWFLFGTGVGFQLAILILKPVTWISVVSFVGVFFGMFCCVAMGAGGYNEKGERVASHSVNGLLGSISVVAYIIVNAEAGHWWSIFDQLCFFFLIDLELLLTWRTWGRGKNNVIRKLNPKQKILSVVVILIVWAGLYQLGLVLHDSNPVWDALELAIGATASWLCFRRYTETYSYWLISDVINVILWMTTLQQGISSASLSMLAMTVFYLATAIMGKMNWKPTDMSSKS